MSREQKKAENKRFITLIQHYENVITKRKPGPKVNLKERLEQF